MTIQLPARASRASATAAIAAALLSAMVLAGRADAATTTGAPVLAQGAGMGAKPSIRVRQVQRALHRRGYDLGAPGVDGRFGPLTAAAVRRLQAARGLAVDGIVGRRTRAALGLRRRSAGARPEKTATTRPAPEPTPTSTPSAATPPQATTVLDPVHDGSGDTVQTTLFWGALGALAALGLASLWRRARPAPRRAEPLASTSTAALRPAPLRPGQREAMIGYLTSSATTWSDEHERSAAAIEATCERSAWELLDIVWDRENGGRPDRPGLRHAFERIASGQAGGLVISDLRQLSPSPQELRAFVAFFRDAGARLVALDMDLDTSSTRLDAFKTNGIER